MRRGRAPSTYFCIFRAPTDAWGRGALCCLTALGGALSGPHLYWRMK